MTLPFTAPLDLRAELVANRLAHHMQELERKAGLAPNKTPHVDWASMPKQVADLGPKVFAPLEPRKPPVFPSLLEDPAATDTHAARAGLLFEKSRVTQDQLLAPTGPPPPRPVPLFQLPPESASPPSASQTLAKRPIPPSAVTAPFDNLGLAVEVEAARRHALAETEWQRERLKQWREAERTGNWERYYNIVWMHEKSLGAPNY